MNFSYPRTNFFFQTSSLFYPILFLLAYVLISYSLLLTDYLIVDSNLLLGLALLPYICIVREKQRGSYTYLLVAIGFLLLSQFIPMRSIHYLTIGVAMLFVLESYLGKLNHLPLFLLLVLAPGFKYLTLVFGFPIRLQLSKVAGSIIEHLGFTTVVQGNIILVNGYEFSVDTACVGLQMMITSFVIGIFLLAYYERKTYKKLSFTFTCIALASIAILNIVCNLVRIVILVVFKLMPDTSFHYLAGLLCLVLYVVIPLHFIIKKLFSYTKSSTLVEAKQTNKKPTYFFISNCLLCLGVLLTGFRVMEMKNTVHTVTSSPVIPGYQKQVLPSGVIKFDKDQAMVYVKPIAKQYGVEHNPMICWKGSGYEFTQINKAILNGTEIYTGILVKGNDKIHTAWWFDNGKQQTINPLSWRWQVWNGSPEFSLINVNASSEQILMQEAQELLSKNLVFTRL